MINQIEINNFKCFSNMSFNLNQLSVLAGINSVGKSSLIQSLLLIRQISDHIKENGLPNPGKKIKVLLNNKFCLQLGDSSQVLHSNANSEEISFTLKNDIADIQFKLFASKTSPELHLEMVNGSEIEIEKMKHFSIFHEQFHYLNTERYGPRVIQEMGDFDFPYTGFKGEYTAHVISKMSDEKVIESKRFKSDDLLIPNFNKQVEYWLDYLFPGLELKTDIFNNLNIVGIGLRRKGTDTEFLNPNNLGFGVSYALPIIVSGLVAEEGSLLIVENPEVHLHPSGQSRIGQFLAQIAASGVQVLIETHSEHVINGIRIASLKGAINTQNLSINFFNLSEDKKRVEVDHILLNEYAELTRWPQGFLDQEQQDLRQLVQLRRGVIK